MSKVGSCDFKRAVGVADNWGRFDDDQYRDRLLNWGRPWMLCEREDIMMSK